MATHSFTHGHSHVHGGRHCGHGQMSSLGSMGAWSWHCGNGQMSSLGRVGAWGWHCGHGQMSHLGSMGMSVEACVWVRTCGTAHAHAAACATTKCAAMKAEHKNEHTALTGLSGRGGGGRARPATLTR
eukprot:360459-Chlamydomonas_euryale.AAC.4